MRGGEGIFSVVACVGEGTALSGDWSSMVVSRGGMGEKMDEWVCVVMTISLHKAK